MGGVVRFGRTRGFVNRDYGIRRCKYIRDFSVYLTRHFIIRNISNLALHFIPSGLQTLGRQDKYSKRTTDPSELLDLISDNLHLELLPNLLIRPTLDILPDSPLIPERIKNSSRLPSPRLF